MINFGLNPNKLFSWIIHEEGMKYSFMSSKRKKYFWIFQICKWKIAIEIPSKNIKLEC